MHLALRGPYNMELCKLLELIVITFFFFTKLRKMNDFKSKHFNPASLVKNYRFGVTPL